MLHANQVKCQCECDWVTYRSLWIYTFFTCICWHGT